MSPAAAVVAVDVGGTRMKCALVGPDGTVHRTERHPTPPGSDPDAVVARVLDVCAGLAATARAAGLRPVAAGIAVPGVVDEASGLAVWAANLGFRDTPLRDLISARLGLPVALAHDVRAGGTAEARLGAGRDTRHVLFVAIGTGVAAAQLIDGHPVTGAHGAAGELGHVIVRPGGPRCGCGARGCLEAVASAAAIARAYADPEVGGPGRRGSGRHDATGRDQRVSAREVAGLVAAGDERAGAVWREAVEALADGLITAQAMCDVELIVIGGGLAQAGAVLLDPLRAALDERITFHRRPELRVAALGDDAGCVGAALRALELVERP